MEWVPYGDVVVDFYRGGSSEELYRLELEFLTVMKRASQLKCGRRGNMTPGAIWREKETGWLKLKSERAIRNAPGSLNNCISPAGHLPSAYVRCTA